MEAMKSRGNAPHSTAALRGSGGEIIVGDPTQPIEFPTIEPREAQPA